MEVLYKSISKIQFSFQLGRWKMYPRELCSLVTTDVCTCDQLDYVRTILSLFTLKIRRRYHCTISLMDLPCLKFIGVKGEQRGGGFKKWVLHKSVDSASFFLMITPLPLCCKTTLWKHASTYGISVGSFLLCTNCVFLVSVYHWQRKTQNFSHIIKTTP